MEITVTSRETIKPSSPTPPHLQHLKLSLIDQYMPPTVYTHVLLFYPSQGDVSRYQSSNMSDRLKRSLSEVLTEFYPVAGQFYNNESIHCNDEGLEYVEARVKAPYTLTQMVNSPQAEELNRLLAYDTYNYGTPHYDKLSAVQVTVFDACGGMVVGVNLSHVLADASSLIMFVNRWAAITRGDALRTPNNMSLPPKFGFASLFPPRDMPVRDYHDSGNTERPQPKFVSKRFVFDQTNIKALKANYTYKSPTRVEAVSALILRCLINVAKPRSSKTIALGLGFNLRSRMNPPLPMQHFGNMALPRMMRVTGPDTLNDLGVQIRKLIREIDSDYIEKLQTDDALLLFETFKQLITMDDDVRVFEISSWCKFPVYEVDFGWGVPVWAASIYPNVADSVMLIDAKDGEIEAWVTLEKDDMVRFESDEALLEFTGAAPMICEL